MLHLEEQRLGKRGGANEKDLEENGMAVPVSIIDAVYGGYTGDGG
ncbi:MAG: hypothetical protein V8R46_00930 [Eubacterium ramulus]